MNFANILGFMKQPSTTSRKFLLEILILVVGLAVGVWIHARFTTPQVITREIPGDVVVREIEKPVIKDKRNR